MTAEVRNQSEHDAPKSREQLERDVLTLAAIARRIEESGRDCAKADEAYMDALFALHDFDFAEGNRQSPRVDQQPSSKPNGD